MIERILPAAVRTAACRNDEIAEPLFPEELALIHRAVPARIGEFTTGRACARRALRQCGFADAAVSRGPKNEPLWPAGIVGSITHCTGYRAAAVAHQQDMLTIGIDAEPHQPLPAGVAARVLDASERAWIGTAPCRVHWDRLMFSAKECVYKAWFPLARAWLDFNEARLWLDPDTGAFEAELLVPPRQGLDRVLPGRFLVEDGLVLTAIAIPR